MSALPIDLALAWKSLPAMLGGAVTTVTLIGIVLVLGLTFALPLTLARISPSRLLSIPATAFVVFFRGAPLLILLYLVYYGFGQVESIRNGPLWLLFGNAFSCAVIGLTLNHTAFMVEVIRGSLLAVPAGLVEASAALGLTPRETLVWIRLPLALRYGMKAYQNEVIMFIKGTAVISVITVTDITAVANGLFEETYDPFTPMLMAAVFYWLIVNVVRISFDLLDAYLSRHIAPRGSSAKRSDRMPAPGGRAGRVADDAPETVDLGVPVAVAVSNRKQVL